MGKKLLVLLIAVLVLAVAAGPGPASAQKGPIKIGVLAPMAAILAVRPTGLFGRA